eukprot:TRINITY_DN11599_c0_g1_i1.p1 TRINITY_DN11599_c0_g1~~TRINITY_DN11599_c0_g1_i1.p1  ORF type:complete len:651 (+),score=191.74 TRINITY_DN11599_c0_g1_i1:85-1953(+)
MVPSTWMWGLGAVAAVVGLAYVYVLRRLLPSGLNLFWDRHAGSPRQAPEMDLAARDAVVKVAYTQKRVPENLDVIVIGSGIGGMAAAALLSRMGKKALVLEQHDQAGGCCHTFEDRGYEFDAGIHYIGTPMTDPASSEVRVMLDAITDRAIEWEKIPDDFDRIVVGENSYRFDGERNSETGQWRFKEHLLSRFPQNKDDIEKFFRKLRRSRKSTIPLVLLKLLPIPVVRVLHAFGLTRVLLQSWTVSTESVIADCTKNPELQAVLSYCWGDYGSRPDEAPWAMQSLLLNHFLTSGAYYPVGGPGQIAFRIAPVITGNGGAVLVRARVRDIVLEGGRAVGVRMDKDGHEIRAPLVISDAGFANTYRKLLPQPQPLADRILTKVQPSVSCMSVFAGLTADAKTLGVTGRNFWVFNSSALKEDFDRFFSLDREQLLSGDYKIPILFASFPSAKDPAWQEKHPGKTTVELILPAKYEWFADWSVEQVKKRGDEYGQLKRAVADKMWERALDIVPAMRDHLDYLDVATPVTNNHYLHTEAGEMYGLDHGLSRFSPEVTPYVRPTTDIKGLYLTGQDTLCCGFAGGLSAGVITVGTILGHNLMADVDNEVLRRKKQRAAKVRAKAKSL